MKSNLLFYFISVGLGKKSFWVICLSCFVFFFTYEIVPPLQGKYFSTRAEWAKAVGLEGVSGFYCLSLKTVPTAHKMEAFPSRVRNDSFCG